MTEVRKQTAKAGQLVHLRAIQSGRLLLPGQQAFIPSMQSGRKASQSRYAMYIELHENIHNIEHYNMKIQTLIYTLHH